MFKDYQDSLRKSERLKLTLDLYKRGKIKIDEALDLIASDVQFHKNEVTTYPAPGWYSGTTYPNSAITTTTLLNTPTTYTTTATPTASGGYVFSNLTPVNG